MKQAKPRPTKQARLVFDADAAAEPHPVLPQPLRLVSKKGSGTKQASLVAEDVAGDDSAQLPVIDSFVFRPGFTYCPGVYVKQAKPRRTKQARLVFDADAAAEPQPVLPQPLRLVSETGSGTKQASLVAHDVADKDEVNDP